mmetsp:Transcript_19784/g.78798  ORF Transcript_19784/g.78798 Transcript_19784/m.78798 type:complete len:166 (+) Transcript_19784:128-625(+)
MFVLVRLGGVVIGNPLVAASCVGLGLVLWRMGCVSGKEQSSPAQKAAAKPAAKPVAAKAPVKKPETVKPEPEPLRPKVTITETDKVTLQLRSTKDELNRLKQRSEIAMEKDKGVSLSFCSCFILLNPTLADGPQKCFRKRFVFLSLNRSPKCSTLKAIKMERFWL